ncbi:sensor domain-containing diguanylate cyclase [Paenisporosarcina antarctica]|uniref:Sensor domain-containing diguanylate cyclase n=2 Tax=Paenisporosarcina antarctica TaxID=417367 RepID=A0A4P7A1C2_9BACL|nr:sensor domain-containing diguanylate cyclase [Paenisporosarcina antarctica]
MKRMETLFNRLSLEVYYSLISNNPDSIIFLDTHGNVLDSNMTCTNMFGYTLNELKKLTYQNMLILNPKVNAKRIFIKTLRGESLTYQVSVNHKNGHILHLQVKNVPVNDNQKLVGVMIVAKDVTDLVKTRISLHETSERLRSIYESSVDAMDVIDLNGNVLMVNSAFENLYGWKLKEISGKPMPTIPKERMNAMHKRREKLKKGIPIKELEVICMRKDGESFMASITISPLYDEHGNVNAFSGISRDISRSKQQEIDLRESKDRYKTLLNASPEPIYVQCKGVIRYINESGIRIFGYSEPKRLLGRNILDFVHSDSKKIASDRIQRTINNTIIPKEKVEQKMIRADGSSFIIEGTATGIEYEGEASVQMIFRDISERKTVEEALVRSEEKYRLIADNMTDLVAIIDENSIVKYASPSFFTVLGFPVESIEGKSAVDIVISEDLPTAIEQFNEALRSTEPSETEFRFKHKTKGWVWVESKVSFFIDEENGKPHLLIVSRDIEERKAFQEKLEFLAFHDELTELPNRRLFQEKMQQTLSEAKRHNRKFALLYMDIDNFKSINDEFGHSIGDELLIRFARKVATTLRECDILARQGGDEFTILLTEITNREDALNCVERIIASLQQEVQVGEFMHKTNSSIGIAFYPEDGLIMDDLIKHADQALYKAKESGRNKYCTY